MIRKANLATEPRLKLLCCAAAFGMCFAFAPVSATPWAPATSALPFPSPLIPGPAAVPGKDFSDFLDRDSLGVGDPEQNIAWDGLGGTRDSFDYEGSRIGFPEVEGPEQVDALGNKFDALFNSVIADRSALLFSVGNVVPSGPGDAHIYFEAATAYGPPATPSGIWAAPVPDIDTMSPVRDVDALEVWGEDTIDDSDHYSIYGDPFVDFGAASFKVAVWEYAPGGHSSSPAFLTTDLAMSIDLQFGGPGDGVFWSHLVELMDVDAMMVQGDRLLFSIAPVTVFDAFGPGLHYDFDGGEIFVYHGAGAATDFLDHGGHLWDTAFDVVGTFGHLGVMSENINALEAVSVVPEPGAIVLFAVATLGLAVWRRRR